MDWDGLGLDWIGLDENNRMEWVGSDRIGSDRMRYNRMGEKKLRAFRESAPVGHAHLLLSALLIVGWFLPFLIRILLRSSCAAFGCRLLQVSCWCRHSLLQMSCLKFTLLQICGRGC